MTPEAIAIMIFSYFFPGYAILRYLHPASFGKYDPVFRFFISIALSFAIYSILGLIFGNRQLYMYRPYVILPTLIAITVIFLALSFIKKPEEKKEIRTGTLRSRLEEIGRRRS